MIKNEFNKQIIIICGLVLIIIIGVGIYFFINQKEYDEFTNFDDNFTNEEIKPENIIEEKIEEQIVIHITGQVVNQGIVKLNDGARVIDAIEAAGGATEKADLSAINLAYLLEDGSQIYVPSVDDERDQIVSTLSQQTQKPLRVNINTAGSAELQKLPGVGSAMAERIITYRKENGKFSAIEELKNVSGIGESKFNNLKEYVYVK